MADLKDSLQQLRLLTARSGGSLMDGGEYAWLNQPHCDSCFVGADLLPCRACGGAACCKRPACAEAFRRLHTPEVRRAGGRAKYICIGRRAVLLLLNKRW